MSSKKVPLPNTRSAAITFRGGLLQVNSMFDNLDRPGASNINIIFDISMVTRTVINQEQRRRCGKIFQNTLLRLLYKMLSGEVLFVGFRVPPFYLSLAVKDRR